jgi:hypothetical protein
MFGYYFRKSRRLLDNVEKYGTAGQTAHGNIIRRRIDAKIHTHTHTHTFVIFNTYCCSNQKIKHL